MNMIMYQLNALNGKESTCRCQRCGFNPYKILGRPPGEGNGNPLQYSCLENLMDRGAWWAVVYVVTEELCMT